MRSGARNQLARQGIDLKVAAAKGEPLALRRRGCDHPRWVRADSGFDPLDEVTRALVEIKAAFRHAFFPLELQFVWEEGFIQGKGQVLVCRERRRDGRVGRGEKM